MISGWLLLGDELCEGSLDIEDGRIAAIHREPVQAEVIVAPGFIDLQLNGAFGFDVAQPGAIADIARRLPRTGVTAFLPTVISGSPLPEIPECAGARPLGLHAEGPLLSLARAGAHPRAAIEMGELGASDQLRLVTLAPERPGALEWIRRLRARGVVVSLGHTDATYEQMGAAVDAGATLVTHLYNAMSPCHHRLPGAVGAALDDDRVTACLIADGVHAHPAALRLAVRAKGVERLALVTDGTAASGMPPGRYRLGSQDVVSDGESVRLANGHLAGSNLTMDRAVREMVRLTGIGIADALRMASEVPARVLGLARKGRIAVGCDADLVLLNDSLAVVGTVIAGVTAYA